MTPFEHLGGHVGIGGRQGQIKIVDRLAFALMQPAFYLHHQDITAPAVFYGFGGIPEADSLVVTFFQKCQVVIPGDLCKRLLHYFSVRPGFGELAHILEVSGREAVHFREGRFEVVRQPVNHLRALALLFLPFQNGFADVPVHQHHGRIGRHDDPQALRTKAILYFRQDIAIVVRQLTFARWYRHERILALSPPGPACISEEHSPFVALVAINKISLFIILYVY